MYWTLGRAPLDDYGDSHKEETVPLLSGMGLVGGKECLLASTVQQPNEINFLRRVTSEILQSLHRLLAPWDIK